MDKKITKIFIILIINLVVFAGAFLLLDYVIFKYFYAQVENRNDKSSQYKFYLNMKNIDYETLKKFRWPTRPTCGEQYKKPGVIIFGCSYGYGSPYEEIEPTLTYKLSKLLKVPVYNVSNPGYSPQMAIMQINSHEFDKEIKNSKYAIYVTIGEHLWRLHTHSNGWWNSYLWPKYDLKGDKLVFHKSICPIIEGSYVVKYIEKIIYAKKITKKIEEEMKAEPEKTPSKLTMYMNNYMKKHFEVMLEDLRKVNPDIKLIILVYKDNIYFYQKLPLWDDLAKEGIKVVKVTEELPEIPGRWEDGYMYPNDGHPSEKAWIKVSDLMVNKLNLFQD